MTLSFNQISGDWSGYAQEWIERKFPGVVALVSIGCGSDSNPASGVTGDKVDVAAQQGAEIADEVERLLGGAGRPIGGDLTAQLRLIDLPLNEPPTREQWTELAKKGDSAGYNAQTQLARLDRGETLQSAIHYPIQSFTFGDSLHMVFLAGEVCVDYSQRLKRELNRDRVWINGYSNDFCAYIPSERLVREGATAAAARFRTSHSPQRSKPDSSSRSLTKCGGRHPATSRPSRRHRAFLQSRPPSRWHVFRRTTTCGSNWSPRNRSSPIPWPSISVQTADCGSRK